MSKERRWLLYQRLHSYATFSCFDLFSFFAIATRFLSSASGMPRRSAISCGRLVLSITTSVPSIMRSVYSSLSFRIPSTYSSMVSLATTVMTLTFSVVPIRCARSSAWRLADTVQSLSVKNRLRLFNSPAPQS